MSRTAAFFFVIMLVLGSCFVAGCSSLPSPDNGSNTPAPAAPQQKKENAGLGGQAPAGASAPASQRYPFDDAAAGILATDIFDDASKMTVSDENGNASVGNFSFEKHIKYVHGVDLDEKGDARSWAFIVDHGSKYSIVSYTNKVIAISDSPGSMAGTEIIPDQILSPRKLFEKNHDLISGTVTSRDLSLEGGNYTITLTGQNMNRILIFDAKTGALISKND